jgi:LPXTG-motif cell wall-anchored protein
MDAGQSGSHTFTEAGTFSYICTPHPFMEGTVRVVAASGGGDQETPAPAPQTDEPPPTAGGEELANTGSDSNALAVLGALLLAAGVAVRRRIRPPA